MGCNIETFNPNNFDINASIISPAFQINYSPGSVNVDDPRLLIKKIVTCGAPVPSTSPYSPNTTTGASPQPADFEDAVTIN